MDGTEALDGTTNDNTAPAPAAPATATQQPATLQQQYAQQNQDAGAPPQVQNPQMGQQTPQQIAQQQGAPAQPQVVKRGGMSGLLDAVADLLDNPHQSHHERDANGNLVTVQDPNKTRGQQFRSILGSALTGAADAMMAPPGPAHTMMGVGAAIKDVDAHNQQQKQQDREQADNNFAVTQKAKQDNLNYQVGIRQLAANNFALTRMQVKGTEDDINFAHQQEDWEAAHGSYDLGTYKGAFDIHQVLKQQPNFFKQLDKGLITAIPVFDDSGNRIGTHVYERRPDVNAQPAPEGTKVPKWTPGRKPGEGWHTEFFEPSNATVGDIDRMNMKYMNDVMGYQKQNAEAQLRQAQTEEAGARAVEARATAVKNYADARKARLEGDQLEGGNGDTSPNEANAEAMVNGRLSPSQMSKRAKDYNTLLPMANAYSLKTYGVPFDAEVSEGRFQARKKTIESFGSGKEGDQIQTFNQFLAHAGDLSQQIDQLRNTNSPALNTPLKALRKQLGDARYAAIQPLITAVRTEHANFLNNNHALHEQDIEEGHDMLSDTMSLAQAQAAIKQFAATATRRVGALNNRYRRVVQTGDVPDLLDPYSRQVINSLGLSQEAQQSLGGAWNQPTTMQQQSSAPPAPTAQQPAQPQQQPNRAPAQNGAQGSAPNGMVSVQIPGLPVGHIPQSALAQFQKDHPNATVIQ